MTQAVDEAEEHARVALCELQEKLRVRQWKERHHLEGAQAGRLQRLREDEVTANSIGVSGARRTTFTIGATRRARGACQRTCPRWS